MMQRDPWLRALVILGVAIAALYLGARLLELATHFGDIIVLFFLAWLLAFILRPGVQSLERSIHLPRIVATSLVYLALFVAVGLALLWVVPLTIVQLIDFANALPTDIEEHLRQVALIEEQLRERNIPVHLPSVLQTPDLGAQVERVASGLVGNTVAIIGGFASVLVSLFIVIMLSFYLVLDGERLQSTLMAIVPDHYQDEAQLFCDSVDQAFGGYLRGTLILMAVFSVGTGVIMATAGLPYLVLLSVLAGLLVVVPFIGPTLAILPPIVIAILSLPTWGAVLVVAGALLIMQIVVVNAIVPKIMGDSVGLHPLVIFLALLVGAKQAGLAGALFAVPVAAVLYATVLILLRTALHERAGQDGIAAESVPHERPTALAELPTDRLGPLRLSVSRAFRRRFPRPSTVGPPANEGEA